MTRKSIPFATDDISALAKSLRAQLAAREARPSHVEMLNMLARAGGHRNFQHLRAQAPTEGAPIPPPAEPEADHAATTAALRCFDAQGRLARWPARRRQQELCLWSLWARIPADRTFTEAELNVLLIQQHLFGDHALLRRDLLGSGLLSRTLDCREYRRIERPPPREAALFIRQVERLRASAPRARSAAGAP